MKLRVRIRKAERDRCTYVNPSATWSVSRMNSVHSLEQFPCSPFYRFSLYIYLDNYSHIFPVTFDLIILNEKRTFAGDAC